MKLRLIGFATLLAATSSTAYAQAPGEYEQINAPGMAPVVAPAVVVTPPPRIRRWSVGLGIGSLDLAPHSAPDATTTYAVGSLSVRYLATRRLEVELAFAGGREQLEDGSEGYREVSQAVLALRYRFKPQRRWNWWLMAGMGSLAVTPIEASDEEREYATQSTLQFGVGIERRFRRFAIQAELRAVGVAPNEDAPPMAYPDGGPSPTEPGAGGGMRLPPYEPPTSSPYEGKAGGQFSISGNYYF